jgi:hypothetical protein
VKGTYRCDDCGSDKVSVRFDSYRHVNRYTRYGGYLVTHDEDNAYSWCGDCCDECRYTFYPEGA